MRNVYDRTSMIEHLKVRGYSPQTIKIYVAQLINLAAYFNKPPHLLSPEHIHRYQVFLVDEKQVSWALFNQAVCAISFFLIMWLATTGP
jgi:hypothetical protein